MKNIDSLKLLLGKNISLSQEIIHSILHQENDCISKFSSGPLRITADRPEQQKVLELCPASSSSDENNVLWSLCLRNGSDEKCLVIEGKEKGQEVRIKGNLYVDGNLHITGSASKDTGGSGWISSSDERLKNYESLQGSLDKLLQLKGVSFTWKEEYIPPKDKKTHIGFIAQKVENVFPDWVDKTNEQEYRLNIEGFEALTVESIRELNQKITNLNQALTNVGTALANLQLEQLRQADRIKKLEEGR